MPVLIRNSDLQFIMSHAKSTYPEECCGFLLGLDSVVRTVERIVSVQNVNQDSRRNRYNIDPKDLIRAMKRPADRI